MASVEKIVTTMVKMTLTEEEFNALVKLAGKLSTVTALNLGLTEEEDKIIYNWYDSVRMECNIPEDFGNFGDESMLGTSLNDYPQIEDDCPLDGDAESALASCGWGTDEDYGCYEGDEW